LKAIIMAGGEGSRLRPLTCEKPKPLMQIRYQRICHKHQDQRDHGCSPDAKIQKAFHVRLPFPMFLRNGSNPPLPSEPGKNGGTEKNQCRQSAGMDRQTHNGIVLCAA